MDKEVWVDLVVDLRAAVACGTIGNAPPVHYNDPVRYRIHQEVKNQVVYDLRGWISTGNCEGENDE